MKSVFGKYGAQFALVGVAAIWGYTFVVVGDAVATYPMFAFLGWRFLLAAIAFALFFPRLFKRFTRRNVAQGLLAGAFLAGGYIFQTGALAVPGSTTPARCAFITGLYIVIVPLVQALLLRRRPRGATIIGVAVSPVGLFVISGLVGGGSVSWSLGDTLALVCALMFTGQMIVLGSSGKECDTFVLTFMQLVVVAVIAGALSFFFESAPLPTEPDILIAIVVCALFASTLAYFIQTWAQKKIPPARAALILVSEPAFGGLFGWGAAGAFPPVEIAGAVLMLAGMLVSELIASKRPSDEVTYASSLEGPLIAEEIAPSEKFENAETTIPPLHS